MTQQTLQHQLRQLEADMQDVLAKTHVHTLILDALIREYPNRELLKSFILSTIEAAKQRIKQEAPEQGYSEDYVKRLLERMDAAVLLFQFPLEL